MGRPVDRRQGSLAHFVVNVPEQTSCRVVASDREPHEGFRLSERGQLMDGEVRSHHAEAHRILVHLALDLDAHPIRDLGDGARQLILTTVLGLEQPMTTFDVRPANRAR